MNALSSQIMSEISELKNLQTRGLSQPVAHDGYGPTIDSWQP